MIQSKVHYVTPNFPYSYRSLSTLVTEYGHYSVEVYVFPHNCNDLTYDISTQAPTLPDWKL